MSKFIEKLKNSTKIAPEPIGFRSSVVRSKPKISLVAYIPSSMKISADSIAGADAALVTIEEVKPGPELMKELGESIQNIPWGLWLKDQMPEDFTESIDPDFLVFPLDTPLLNLRDKTGKILEIGLSAGEGVLRAIGDLPENAVLINEKPEKLTWRFLAQVQRIDNLVSKSLLVNIPPSIEINNLQMLWNAGADGIVVDASAGEATIKELRQLIDKAEFPLPRKSRRAEVTLASIPIKSTDREEEEGEEEEEE